VLKFSPIGIIIASRIAVVLTAACGGASTPSSPSMTSPPSASTAASLSGAVSSAAGGRVSGANIAVLDGPNAGRTATTNSAGDYRLDNLTAGNANVEARSGGFLELRQGIAISGATTLDFTLQPAAAGNTFGAGRHRIGIDILPGRYYTDPSADCYWERQSGLGGTSAEIISAKRVDFDALQWIVDILPSDRGFQTSAECGTWSRRPLYGPHPDIRPGLWLVRDQVTPGTYTANANAGCYWERLRNFENGPESILVNELVSSPEPRVVTISPGDNGFLTTANCGTWRRSSN
jgi:hypothetical protein